MRVVHVKLCMELSGNLSKLKASERFLDVGIAAVHSPYPGRRNTTPSPPTVITYILKYTGNGGFYAFLSKNGNNK